MFRTWSWSLLLRFTYCYHLSYTKKCAMILKNQFFADLFIKSFTNVITDIVISNIVITDIVIILVKVI